MPLRFCFRNDNDNGTSAVCENMAYVHDFWQKLKPAAVSPHPGSHRLLGDDITQVTLGWLTFTWTLWGPGHASDSALGLGLLETKS